MRRHHTRGRRSYTQSRCRKRIAQFLHPCRRSRPSEAVRCSQLVVTVRYTCRLSLTGVVQKNSARCLPHLGFHMNGLNSGSRPIFIRTGTNKTPQERLSRLAPGLAKTAQELLLSQGSGLPVGAFGWAASSPMASKFPDVQHSLLNLKSAAEVVNPTV